MKKSVKVCWAIGLLIVQISITAIRYLTDYGAVYFISILSESIPTIGAIVLIFYDYKYNSPIIGNFTLLRAWSIGLIWVQPAISFLSWSIAGLIDSVIGTWIGSCVFIIITTILLVNDGKEFVKEKQNKDTRPLPTLVRIDDEASIDDYIKIRIDKQEYHTVTFYRANNSGTTTSYSKLADLKIQHVTLIENQASNVPLSPLTWYTTPAGNIEWNLYSDEVKSDMNLYGRW